MHSLSKMRRSSPHQTFVILSTLIISFLVCSNEIFAAVPRLPGTDQSDKLTAAGTVLRMLDTALFVWGARILSGLSVLGAGWSIKEQRFGVAVLAIVGAVVIGTSPLWVKNIFDVGGGSIFSAISSQGGFYV